MKTRKTKIKKENSNIELFVANIYKTESAYDVLFYDFAGCISAGDDINSAVQNAKIALQMHIDGMIDDGETIPSPSSIETIIEQSYYEEPYARVLIEAKVSREKKKRIDITLDESLINMIDTLSNNRSEFISMVAKEYIQTHSK